MFKKLKKQEFYSNSSKKKVKVRKHLDILEQVFIKNMKQTTSKYVETIIKIKT